MKGQAITVFFLIFVMSCSSKVVKPKNLISEEKMVNIIYEVSILTAAKGVNKRELEDNGIFPEEFVYSKYNIDSLQFVSSLDYYASKIDTYDKIYTKVEERIMSEKERIEIVVADDKKNNKNKKHKKVAQRSVDQIVGTLKVDSEKIKFDEFGLKIQEISENFRDKDVFKLIRVSSIDPAYLRLKNQKISKGETIEISVYVKKIKDSSAFGLRVAGVYPNRVDAVFNLTNGSLKEVRSTGYFENEKASIKLVDKDWYQCKIIVKANIDQVRGVLGPTDINKSVNGWELKSKILSSVYTTIPVITRE
jgi:hypothetical protein